MAGGTGGHIFPALAVAEKLREHGANIDWLGTQSGMEFSLVPQKNIPLHLVSVKGFRGKGIVKKILSPFLLLKAIIEAIVIIRKVAPDVVIGFGGYVAAPGGIAAYLSGKALIIHEQNSVAGSTNKLLSIFATKKLEAFSGSLTNALLVGNPVRESVVKVFNELDDKTNVLNNIEESANGDQVKNILIMGGSLGAAAINSLVPHAINQLPKNISLKIWHQTGKDKSQQVTKDYKDLAINARVDEFIEDVTAAYRWADIIVCRAGALTVSEVAIVGLPAIFIPYPHAIDNHQVVNAQWLVKNNAAKMIEQSDLDVASLSAMLNDFLSDKQKMSDYSLALKKLAMPNSAQQVADVCEAVCLAQLRKRENKNAS
jgi:UDP-N-acetylglucosamine--N-acetylmuramyl-(pentapeptide) pyrophosphoryl-undecaprenol N-acetylglucosamine transferase